MSRVRPLGTSADVPIGGLVRRDLHLAARASPIDYAVIAEHRARRYDASAELSANWCGRATAPARGDRLVLGLRHKPHVVKSLGLQIDPDKKAKLT